MSDESKLPPNGAKGADSADHDEDVVNGAINGAINDEGNDADEALDAEEAAAASALAQALEGRSAAARLPDAALETAALLRYSGAAAGLSNERRAALREQVLASLPAAATRTGSTRGSSSETASTRSALWRWLGLGVPLVGAAAAVWLVVGAFERAAEPELSRRADERAASALAQGASVEGAAAKGAAAPNALAVKDPIANALALNDPTANDTAANDTAANGPALRAKLVAPSDTLARRGAAANELQWKAEAPSALASRVAAAPSAASSAGPSFAAERPTAQASRTEGVGSGAGLGTLEAKRATAPANERIERSSQRYRARLLPQLGDARVDQAYALLDRAQTTSELRQAQTSLTALSSGALGTSGETAGATSGAPDNTADETATADLLRQDIYCRLAEVALRLGQPDIALDWARRGLELEAPPSPFTARLWHVAGQARAALGDQDGAAKSYLKAIEVNERLLDESLDGMQ